LELPAGGALPGSMLAPLTGLVKHTSDWYGWLADSSLEQLGKLTALCPRQRQHRATVVQPPPLALLSAREGG
jgi:hypothetical protein